MQKTPKYYLQLGQKYGAADAEKEDTCTLECLRQLSDIKTYLRLTEEEIKTLYQKFKINLQEL